MDFRFGPRLDAGSIVFRLWAPEADEAETIVDGRQPVAMTRGEHGLWQARVEACGVGTRYRFRIGGDEFADPASRWQDRDTAGWSTVVSPLPAGGHRPRPWHETVLCEVHVGTASNEGTFAGLANHLAHFRDAGFTTLCLMPVQAFPGRRSWGYDTQLPFAPAPPYGTREDLRALVGKAHELGLDMILEVVPRPLDGTGGPETTADFWAENALMWLGEFDADGLRLDLSWLRSEPLRGAVVAAIASAARTVKPEARLVLGASTAEPPAGPVTAHTRRDLHDVLHYLVTGEMADGYGPDGRDPFADLEHVLAEGHIPRDREAHHPCDVLAFLQDHESIGGRPDGQRLPHRISARKLDFLHFLLLMTPAIPQFFMGEEGHLRSPFPAFADEAAFEAARLPWGDFERPDHRASFKRFTELTALRRALVWPLTAGPCLDATTARARHAMVVNWHFAKGTLSLALNASDWAHDIDCTVPSPPVSTGEFQTQNGMLHLGPWSALAWVTPA